MPLDAPHSPASFALTAAGWRRPEIEAAVEWLIALLDARDTDANLEPDPEGEAGDGLTGDEDDAEDALPLERVRVARRVRTPHASCSELERGPPRRGRPPVTQAGPPAGSPRTEACRCRRAGGRAARSPP